ncbi:MAG TPA: hypothetical protein VLI71_08270 [Gammaproteobacteria bacterium]|nr:hypothetical protein [Gammaproteobacteria bacterium]
MNRFLTTALALAAAAAAHGQVLTELPRAANGRPDLSGVWQALNTAHWNLEPHVSDYPVLLELGAQFAVPPGPGVVVGGEIPYLPEARAERDRRFDNRLVDDPEGKCYMGGVPRSTYMPYPFQILQSERDVVIYYQFATAFRRIFVDGKDEAPLDSWMGWSNGRWDGDTFVVEVTGLNGLTWLDRAGNYASGNAKITERYTPLGPNHLRYEATIDDSTVFSRPWAIRMPLYRIVDEDFRVLEFKCEPYAEEKIYGHLRKPGTTPPVGASSQ